MDVDPSRFVAAVFAARFPGPKRAAQFGHLAGPSLLQFFALDFQLGVSYANGERGSLQTVFAFCVCAARLCSAQSLSRAGGRSGSVAQAQAGLEVGWRDSANPL